jgi:exopolysaccharide biosynthesis polyprenyl glycosylphosphotransferase
MLLTSIFNPDIRKKLKKFSGLYKNIRFLKRLLNLIEFTAVIIAIFLSYLFTFLVFQKNDYTWSYNIPQLVFFTILTVISWYVSNQVSSMAKLPRTQRYLNFLFSFIRANFIILIILVSLKYVLHLNSVPVIFIMFYVTLSMLFILGIKFFATRILRIYRSYGHNIRQVMVIADNSSIGIIDKLIEQKEWGFKVKYIISDSELIKEKYGRDIPVLPDNRDVKNILDNHVIDEVIYSKNETYDNEIKALMYICNEVGVIFRFQSSVSPMNPVSVQLETINDQNQLTLVDIPSNRLSLIVKTMSDLYFSITALILASPFLLLIALIIKIESKGPVLFKQERIGLRGRKFKLYKFRTMVVNAEELLERLKARNEADGPTFKLKDDPRVTRFGKFLRKTGLDELPQLFNVVTGEMSLIGPRPPIESEVKQYERWQLRRLSVKPGITCTWQIIPNRNDVKFEKWMQLDLNYIDNWSLAKDAELLFKTITTVFLATGR